MSGPKVAGADGRRILDNFLVLLAAQTVGALTGLLSTAFLARALGTEAYGILGFGTAFLSFFGLAVVLGTDLYGMREIAHDRGRAAWLVPRILGLRAAAVAVISVVFVVIIARLDLADRIRIVLVIQGVGLFVTAATLDFVFQGVQRMGAMATRQVLASLLVLAAVLALIREPGDIYLAAAIPVAAGAAGVLWMAIHMHRRLVPFAVVIDAGAWRPMLRAALPMAAAGLMSAVFFQIDIVMLGFLVEEHPLGLYVGASRILMISVMLAGLVSSVFGPVLAAAFSDRPRMRGGLGDFATTAMFVGAPAAAMGIAFPGDIIAIIFGAKFQGAEPALTILMVTTLFSYGGIAAGAALIGWRDQTAHMLVFALGGGANVVLNIILIPRYGIEGAAAATLAAQALVCAGLMIRLYVKFNLFEFSRGLVLVLCAAVAVGVVRLAVELFGGGLNLAPGAVRFAAATAAAGIIHVALAVALKAVSPARIWRALDRRIQEGG